jgi:putative hemolysin
MSTTAPAREMAPPMIFLRLFIELSMREPPWCRAWLCRGFGNLHACDSDDLRCARRPTYTSRMIKYLLLPACAFVMAACAQPQPPRVGMANPASVYCQKLGGKTIMKSNDKGQYGMCQLPDGSQIEEWELYRRDHPQK